MARDLQPYFSETTMATRVNMLKLLQEVSGHANFTHRRLQARSSGVLMLPLRAFRSRAAGETKKKILTIMIQDPPDIPAPVAIRHLQATASRDQPRIA